MTFIIRAGIGGEMDPLESGVASGWGGVRTTRQLVEKFPDNAGGKLIAANEGNTVQYPKIYIPGSYQGWDVSDTDNSLSSPNNDKVYEGYRYFPDANTGLLFTRVPSFGLSLGDRDGDGTLEMGQDTIYVQDPGFYYFRVDLNDNTYTIEKREWGIIGDATPGGWDNDTDLVWDEESQALVVELNLVPGEIKFRANDDWAVNLGDSDGDVVLELDGDNIAISEGGSARITLFLDKPDYTFEVALLSFDNRGRFFSEGQTLDIEDISLFEEGYAITKFRNINSDGTPGSDSDFPDTDFPMFRLGDVYLMASEAILRAGGDINKATEYYNAVVQRAFQGGTKGNITSDQLTLDLLLDERARELYWECHRRTDLVRFGQFSNGTYVWAWKGGVMEGQAVDPKYDYYPIPSSDLGANPNLVQNEGY
ncbi:MAG: RagB/SusD family nutrient uptake outer membrane protein [Saprospiraceae bacterium]|nr:RagB/SusD family nutrient uptake outer membrane protein [Saprospiraceae bacterium]